MKVAVLCSCLGVLMMTGEAVAENIQQYICNQRFTGYRLDYAQRRCTRGVEHGCVNPFPYNTKKECLSDFRGKGNICDTSNPCQNGGVCMPVTTRRKGRTIKCDCYETGFFGKRCHRKCPKVLNKRSKQTACIQIG